ncbi:ABC transporter ATP-binding protein [Clostridium algidicarnis]|uniref:ABC transporter ATP-binding protein n=1 Tax=Clostridium algidicarnis TaxID=37659 RepID=A0ABS6C6D1_9CLOT|nr:ABC transporter ATP-binding protein [Clostridium algidicarnis]MBU3221050.1 ABC transporter ATP-binding protein [Clostridium algidicarnis]
MSLIELNNITKSYGDKTIFKDFSLKVEGGDFIALTGDSGCGKSTLLNIIGLLEEFDSGEIIIDGKTSPSPNSGVANKILREKISYLFQNFALVDEETVEYNLKLACKYVKANRQEKEFSISEALKHVGLKGYEKRKIYELSGGEQQRVAIARIMLKPSKIILADEPTGSLDEKNRDVVLNLLKTLNKEGKTLILVTHDKYVASQCDKIIQLTP